MKKGIVIVFSNDEQRIKENDFSKLKHKDNPKFCFVNNASKDQTLKKLKEINETILKNVSIIDIKKNKGLNAAIKAGIRYLKNNEDFNSIVYFEFSKLKNYKNLEKTFDLFINKEKVLNFISTSSNRNIFKNVFSIEPTIK